MMRTVCLTLLFLAMALPLRAADVSTLLEKKTFTDKDGKSLLYRLLKPEGYDPNKHYPLVVFLHGAGERGKDNSKQLIHGVPEFAREENRKTYPCFLVAPQCPDNKKWSDVDWFADTHTQPAKPSEPGRLVLALIDPLCKEFSIDRHRIYLTGLSMGGYGTWDLLARRPDLFAAAVPICGGGDEAQAARIAHIPIWVFHGGKDGVVKPARSRHMVEALKKAGGDPRYTEYPNVGHDSWVRAYKDPELMKWLFAQRRPDR